MSECYRAHVQAFAEQHEMSIAEGSVVLPNGIPVSSLLSVLNSLIEGLGAYWAGCSSNRSRFANREWCLAAETSEGRRLSQPRSFKHIFNLRHTLGRYTSVVQRQSSNEVSVSQGSSKKRPNSTVEAMKDLFILTTIGVITIFISTST